MFILISSSLLQNGGDVINVPTQYGMCNLSAIYFITH